MRKNNKTLIRKISNIPKYLFMQKFTFHKLDWLEWISLVLSLWFLIYPHPYNILLGILLGIPILGLIINGLDRPSIATLFRVNNNVDENNGKIDIADFIDLPAIAVTIRVFKDFEFDNFSSLILPGSFAFIGILATLFLTHKLIDKNNESRYLLYFLIIINITLYSFAGTYAINCAYDDSKPTIFETEVLDKRISESRRRRRRYSTYYINIVPWGHHLDREEINIHRSLYYELNPGDKVKINLKKGVFNIPWYSIIKKHSP